MQRVPGKNQGFTLIEMLIVLFVIGALLVIIVPSLSATGVQAQEKACAANKKLILAQAEAYYLSKGKTYPADISELVTAGYLREEPSCPAYLKEDEASETAVTLKGAYTLKVDTDKDEIQVICSIHDKNGG